LLQPGSAEKGAGRNTTPVCSFGAANAFPEVGTEAGLGAVTQDATSAQSAATLESIAMAWILLEALVALLLAVFIVWYTMGGRRKPPSLPPAKPSPAGDETGRDTHEK
jgi:hypothetical protein